MSVADRTSVLEVVSPDERAWERSFAAEDPQVVFVYNTVYRPEFISAAVISTLVSGCGLSHLPQGAAPLTENQHALLALPLYVGLVYLLLKLTWTYRRRFAPIRVVLDSQYGAILLQGQRRMQLRDVVGLSETITRFYGRRVRELTIRDLAGDDVIVTEILFGYDRFKQMILELCPVIEIETSERPGALTGCRERWDARQDNFLASEDPIRFHSNTPFFVCVILLLIVDGVFNVFAQSFLVVANHPDLIVYLTPISVIVSALATRFGYYYLFTAVSLNPRKGAM